MSLTVQDAQEKTLMGAGIFTIGLVALFLFYLFFMVGIPTGYIGIPVLFGKVQGGYLDPGIHVLNPFVNVIKMDLQTQKADEEGVVPSQEMLNMTLRTSVNYHLNKDMAGKIYNDVGMNYFEKLVEPHISSSIREVTSDYKAEQFFSNAKNEITARITTSLKNHLAPRGIVVESVMLKEVLPPEAVRVAIEKKQSQQQEAEAMKFRLQREELEAQRKIIEANGINKFQEIVKRGIDANLIAWKGIEATEALAKSPNTKIIVIGNKDSNGLPLILSEK